MVPLRPKLQDNHSMARHLAEATRLLIVSSPMQRGASGNLSEEPRIIQLNTNRVLVGDLDYATTIDNFGDLGDTSLTPWFSDPHPRRQGPTLPKLLWPPLCPRSPSPTTQRNHLSWSLGTFRRSSVLMLSRVRGVRGWSPRVPPTATAQCCNGQPDSSSMSVARPGLTQTLTASQTEQDLNRQRPAAREQLPNVGPRQMAEQLAARSLDLATGAGDALTGCLPTTESCQCVPSATPHPLPRRTGGSSTVLLGVAPSGPS